MNGSDNTCQYREICANYIPEGCLTDDYWLKCDTFRMFDGILDREIFETKIRKQIFRDEHPRSKSYIEGEPNVKDREGSRAGSKMA